METFEPKVSKMARSFHFCTITVTSKYFPKISFDGIQYVKLISLTPDVGADRVGRLDLAHEAAGVCIDFGPGLAIHSCGLRRISSDDKSTKQP